MSIICLSINWAGICSIKLLEFRHCFGNCLLKFSAKMLKIVLLVAFLFCLAVRPTIEANVKGVALLDELNFDKIVPRFDTVLVKFDAVYPFGEKHDAFKAVVEELIDSDGVLFVHIGIKDFGDHDNQKLAERYGIMSKKDWPALRLFVKGEDEPFAMNNNRLWNANEIKKFIKEHSNVYLGLQGCLESFDKLASEFASSRNKEAILQKAEQEAVGLRTEAEKKTAKTYIKYMKKALEKDSFIQDEKKRLEKIVNEGKVKAEKKQDLQIKTNILTSFNPQKSEL